MVKTRASTLSVYSALLLPKWFPLRDILNDIIERTVAAGLGQKWNRLSNSELYEEKRLKRESKMFPSNHPRNNQPMALSFEDGSHLFTIQ